MKRNISNIHFQCLRVFKKKTRKKKTVSYFDFVSVHWRVGNKDTSILYSFGLVETDLFVKQEAAIQERVCQSATLLFDDLNSLEVSRSLQTNNSIDTHLGKEFFVLSQNL